jgi:outer membrane biogenesis lipoprotein LolB
VIVAGALGLLLCACPHAAQTPPLNAPPLDADALFDQLQRAHSRPATLSCEAKAYVSAPENGGRYPLQISVRRPASMRIAALDPLGNPAALLVADAGRFALLDVRNSVFYRGAASPENLARLIPAPLRDEEMVSLLLGAIPELPGAEPLEAHRAGDGTVLILGAGPLTQEVSAGADLHIDHVRRFENGKLLWAVTLDDYDDSSGQQMPSLLRLSVPGKKTEVELQLKDRIWGKPPPSGAFQLGPPAGMRVVDLH